MSSFTIDMLMSLLLAGFMNDEEFRIRFCIGHIETSIVSMPTDIRLGGTIDIGEEAVFIETVRS